MKKTEQHIEALIFAAETGVSLEEIREILATLDGDPKIMDENAVASMIENISRRYATPESILELKFINNSYQFLTKPEYHPTINRLVSHRSKKKLSQAALETLAIIAYRQPVTKLEIEHIRGVNCDYTIQRLLEKELISIQGKADSAGRPLLYGTSPLLMDYFGLNDISELPQLKEITTSENSIGESPE